MDKNTDKFCEKWLCFWTTLASRLASDQFTETDVYNLIKYEVKTRQRKHVLKRLTGRYYKLVRIRNWKHMKGRLGNANSGEGSRRTPEKGS